MEPLPKSDRIRIFHDELLAASPARDMSGAREQLARILNSVEDRYSGVRFNPAAATAPPDGRMYPPDDAFERRSSHASIRVFAHRQHRTSFGANGAIHIELSDGTPLISKPGANGKTIEDLKRA